VLLACMLHAAYHTAHRLRPPSALLLQGFKLGLCDHPPVGLPYSMLCLSNNCCIEDTVRTLLARFNKLYKRK
jgi:hypothetical protein